VVVPRSALLQDDGRTLVYVQLDGEHFAERAVKLGPSAAGQVAVKSGLRHGERIVTRGANVIRLASRRSAGPTHGHVH
jgi:multidrug efflux pump subunit AcrA (membrane-fusion protein)